MIIDKSNIHKYIRGTSLDCSCKGVTSIEDIPDNITGIFCYGNNLTSLPNLPNGLSGLDCSYNKLTSLPYLPDSLEYLDCYTNNLTSYTEGDPHSGYPEDTEDKQWVNNHNKLLNRVEIINKINDHK